MSDWETVILHELLKENEKIFSDAADCNFSKAQPNARHSGLGLVPTKDQFWASVDQVLFNRPVDIVKTVLEANGYRINLENFLGALETMSLAVKGKVGSRLDEQGLPLVKTYSAGLTFDLPRQSKVGDLLNLFYSELSSYGVQLASAQPPPPQSATADIWKLQEELDQTRQRCAELRSMNAQLADRLQTATAVANRQVRSSEQTSVLPEDLQVGIVKSVTVARRSAQVVVDGRTVSTDLARTIKLPVKGDRCLVQRLASGSETVYFLDEAGSRYDQSVATVLAIQDQKIKVRDDQRSVYFVEAQNVAERQTIGNLNRGNEILIKIHEGSLISFAKLHKRSKFEYHWQIQSKELVRQLEDQESSGSDASQSAHRLTTPDDFDADSTTKEVA